MSEFHLWTDGASNGKSGTPGGWAAVLIDTEGGMRIAVTGHEPSTTNNRMELAAVIGGLEALGSQGAKVKIHTDSAYVKNAFTQGWLRGWRENGWISSRGDPVANQDLWERLFELSTMHVFSWVKVRGHQTGNGPTKELNDLVDKLAVQTKKTQTASMEFI